jgi:hypothetical protein
VKVVGRVVWHDGHVSDSMVLRGLHWGWWVVGVWYGVVRCVVMEVMTIVCVGNVYV